MIAAHVSLVDNFGKFPLPVELTTAQLWKFPFEQAADPRFLCHYPDAKLTYFLRGPAWSHFFFVPFGSVSAATLQGTHTNSDRSSEMTR
jgi:hypothetical protein